MNKVFIMKKIILILISNILLSCVHSDKVMNNGDLKKQENIIKNVKLAINPIYQDWVLFEHGTYIIFDNADTIPNIENKAIELIKKYGPIIIGTPSGDFNVISLNKTEGWTVSSHGYGIYTYVNPKELNFKNPKDYEVGLFGRNKRDLDGKSPIIIYTNRKSK